MSKQRFAIAAILAATVAGAGFSAARGQDAVAGFSAHGGLVMQAPISGQPINLGANIALAQRASLTRLDVLSLSIPGTDATLNAIAAQLFPQGGYTAVYDQSRGTLVVWSPSKRTYAQVDAPKGRPGESGARASSVAGSSLLGAFRALRPLSTLQKFSLSLSAHGTTNGHPTTGIDYAIAGGHTPHALNLSGRMQLADDLDEFPVQISANGTVNGMNGALRMDLTSIDRATPPEASFAVPDGFTRVKDVKDVLGRTLPI